MPLSKLFTCPFVALTFLLVPSALFSQGSSSSFDLDKLSPSAKAQSSLTALLTAEQLPSGDVVDPATYVLGPGDVLSYQSTGLDFSEKLAMVTPENTIMLERSGILSVEGMTLARLRDTLSAIVRKRNAEIMSFVTLRRARIIYVSLRGNVSFPGTYAVPASMRVSTFINIMRQPWLLSKDGGLGELARSGGQQIGTGKSYELTRSIGPTLGPYAMRNIRIRHRQGATLADLSKSRVEGFANLDPHLREGDEVIVPFEDKATFTIAIGGAVVTPTALAYKSGDRISVLLAAGSGLDDDADPDRVVLIQPDGMGKKTISVDEHFRVRGEDLLLQPGSSVIVEKKVITGSSSVQGFVQVYGEVRNPSAVVITPGVTKLSNVIALVGGLTPQASTALTYVVRSERGANSVREQRDDAARLFQYSDLRLEDTTRYHIDQKYRLPYVSCDVTEALRDTTSGDNIFMSSGDIVVVPATPNRVFVYGQVNRPGYIDFTPSKRLEWYVDRAGGFASGAVENRSRIIKGKTKVWVEDGRNKFVEPGDEVYVPRPPDLPIGTELQNAAVLTSIVTSVVFLTATLISIFR